MSNEWTVETVRESVMDLLAERDRRFQQRFDAQERALTVALKAITDASDAAFTAAERATTKAEVAAERRFESVNAFRAQLTDQATTFMPRAEYEAKHDALSERVESMLAASEDKASAANRQVETRLAAIVASLGQLASRIDLNDGRATGLNAGWGYLGAAIGMITAVAAIIITLILH